jgi:hypothetical protein
MRARHAPAFPIGQDNVMAGRSTACTNCDWFRALHAVGQYILPPQPLRRGKGGPIEGRPMIKSEFCQIPPNRLQPVDRIAPTWSIGLSTIGQSAVFDRAPDSHDHVHDRTVAINLKNSSCSPFNGLSIPKMLCGANAFKISDQQLDPR